MNILGSTQPVHVQIKKDRVKGQCNKEEGISGLLTQVVGVKP